MKVLLQDKNIESDSNSSKLFTEIYTEWDIFFSAAKTSLRRFKNERDSSFEVLLLPAPHLAAFWRLVEPRDEQTPPPPPQNHLFLASLIEGLMPVAEIERSRLLTDLPITQFFCGKKKPFYTKI